MKTAGSVLIILSMLMACSQDSEMDKYNKLIKRTRDQQKGG